MIQKLIDFILGLFAGKKETPKPAPKAVPIAPEPPAVQQDPPKRVELKHFTREEVAQIDHPMARKEFCLLIYPLARYICGAYGIDPLIPVAQAAYESGDGNSGLARNGLNLFGIKPNDKWIRDRKLCISFPTKEYVKGKPEPIDVKAAFRAYSSWFESIIDWCELMGKAECYQGAFRAMKIPSNPDKTFQEISKFYATKAPQAYHAEAFAVYQQVKKLIA